MKQVWTTYYILIAVSYLLLASYCMLAGLIKACIVRGERPNTLPSGLREVLRHAVRVRSDGWMFHPLECNLPSLVSQSVGQPASQSASQPGSQSASQSVKSTHLND